MLQPEQEYQSEYWYLKAYCDSDYAGDKDTRQSITGYVIYFQGSPVSWCSRFQWSMTLLSAEAEYIAVLEVCAEIMHCKYIVEFMGVVIILLILVNVDNFGVVYFANSVQGTWRKKHIDM